MTNFLIYMVGNAILCAILGPFLIKKARTYNRVLLRCSACGAKLHTHPTTKRWWWIDMMAWVLVAWFTVWRSAPYVSFGITILFFFVSLVVWGMAVKRLVHAYWMWRHPWRCQGGGHLDPVPQT